MKNKRTVLTLILFALTVIAYSQQNNAESDFQIEWDSNVKGGVMITKYTGSRQTVGIPPSIQNYPVTGIGKEVFAKNTRITGVTIPDSVKSIGEGAFGQCTSLTSITIPNGVIGIGDGAFAGCTKLTSVIFQGTITSGNLDNQAFGIGSESSIGDLRAKYLAGGAGTYTRFANGQVWMKQ
ncbi:MAG: leucine-rich repeat domain-containing protein [Treponema sp.]|jgi:hypothetical protein|nr:leucine-rich repeat domain-containing protein [Treponema sp.]